MQLGDRCSYPQMLRAVLIAGFLACAPTATWAQSQENLRNVSLAALIGNPAAHDGEYVRVVGYFSGWHFEDCGLYLSKSDFEEAILESAVLIEWRGCLDHRAKRLNGQYVAVEGVFHADRRRYPATSRSVIGEVSSVQPNVSLAEFRRKSSLSWWQVYWLKVTVAVLFILASTWASYVIARHHQG